MWRGSKAEMANKIGRNKPCACGSGKKYKKCCLLESRATPATSNLYTKIHDGELPFRAEVRSKDGSPATVKISDVKIVIDGAETTVVDDDMTLSTKMVHFI